MRNSPSPGIVLLYKQEKSHLPQKADFYAESKEGPIIRKVSNMGNGWVSAADVHCQNILLIQDPEIQVDMQHFQCTCLGQRTWATCRMWVSRLDIEMFVFFIQVVWEISDFKGSFS